MQITTPTFKEISTNSLYALIGGGVAAQYMSFGLAGKVVSGGVTLVGAGYALAIAGVVGIAVVGIQNYNVYNNKQIVAGYCGDISFWGNSRV